MARWNTNLIVGLLGLIAAMTISSTGFAEGPATPVNSDSLLSIGKVGPDPIALRVWTQRGKGATFQKGEPIVLNFESDRKAYVLAMNVSPAGDVVVLFPNGESPDNLILPGKTYTLFGPDSSIRLIADPGIKEARIVFFASSEPVDLGPLTVPEGQAVIKIPHSATAKLDLLKKKLKLMAQTKGFGRQVALLKSVGQSAVSVELMGVKRPPRSSKPGSVIGGQGAKPNAEMSGKE